MFNFINDEENINETSVTEGTNELEVTTTDNETNVEPVEETKDYLEVTKEEIDVTSSVEEKRNELFSGYKKSRRISNIAMIVAVLLVLASFILIVQNGQVFKILGYACAGVAIVGMIAYYIIMKKKFPLDTKGYIRDVTLILDKHAFNNAKYSDVRLYPEEKMELSTILSDRVYANAVDIGSRNVVRGTFDKKTSFLVSEVALYHVGEKKKKELSFVGKYVSLPNSLHFEGRYIISIRGEKESDNPTDTQDLVELENSTTNVKVFGPEGKSLADSGLTVKQITNLLATELNKYLLAVNIVLWEGHTAIYLSYDDPVVSLPFDKAFEVEPLDTYSNNLLHILEKVSSFNK